MPLSHFIPSTRFPTDLAQLSASDRIHFDLMQKSVLEGESGELTGDF
jgi:hypothetical protein